ncbi:MAG: hypothetical protein HWE34_04385 [Methylocystaceae bacterium]|nr:hypothetical protein [Methylocystaceae bacterium]
MNKRIHIFKSGTFRSMEGHDLTFSDELLSQIAAIYNTDTFEAPTVIGHPKTDDPAFGWIKAVHFEDGGLYAEADQIDPAFAEMVHQGKFKKISPAFFTPTSPNNPTPGKWYLRHVGFLGAAAPAVKGLQPVHFSDADEGVITVEFAEISGWTIADIGRGLLSIKKFLLGKYDAAEVNDAIPDWTAEGLIEKGAFEAGKEAGEEEAEPSSNFSEPSNTDEDPMKTKAQTGTLSAEEIAARQQKLEADEAAFAERQMAADAKAFIAPLVTQGKILPAEENLLASFMASLSSEDIVSFADGDETKNKGQLEIFQNFLTGLPTRVNFSEETGGADTSSHTVSFAGPDGMQVNQDKLQLHAKAVALQQKTPGLAYLDAVTQVQTGA